MTTPASSNNAGEHPMIPVPLAVRIVLRETARKLLQKHHADDDDSVSIADDCIGRIVAHPILAPAPGYPPYRASIVDGYAIAATNKDKSTVCTVRGAVHAGPANEVNTAATTKDTTTNDCYYVTTGARVPDVCDRVVPVELVQDVGLDAEEHKMIRITEWPSQPWIRPIGCDIPTGSVVLEAGMVVDAIAQGLLRQALPPQSSIAVRPIVTVGVLSTGNELRDDDASGTVVGTIPDVNRSVLLGLLRDYYGSSAVHTIDLGIVRDDNDDAIVERLVSAAACDILITTGGVSRGATDRMEHVLTQLLGGTIHFGRLHMKPGKPTTFVTLPNDRNTLVFALPGNPVSAVVCSHLLVRPCIELLMQGLDTSADSNGANTEEYLDRVVSNARVAYPEQMIHLSTALKLDTERPEYHRVDSNLQSTGVQRSSRLMSLRDAFGLVLLPQGTPARPTATPAEPYRMLRIHDRHRIRVDDAQHLVVSSKSHTDPRCVSVMTTANDFTKEAITHGIHNALSGFKSGAVTVANVIAIPSVETAAATAVPDNTDILVVIGPSGLLDHARLVAAYQQRLSKCADAMALEAQRGAASDDATSPLYATVVGLIEKVIVIVVPLRGWQAALSNVRGLLKHALQTARS